MKRLRESVAAVILLLLLTAGFFSVIIHPQTLLSTFINSYCASASENTSIVQKLEASISGAESAVAESINQNTSLITLYGGVQRLIGNEIIYDASLDYNVIRLKNNKLNFYIQPNPNDPSACAALLNDFTDYNSSLGIPTLFVLAPIKIDKYSDTTPIGITTHWNDEADSFLQMLTADSLDLRDTFHNSEKGHDYYFFNTDHHWTPEGAFLGFKTIAERLRSDYGFDIDPAATYLDSYKKVTYENIFLGSQGKRVGPLYAGVDDLTLVLPAEETSGYSFSIPFKNEQKSGSFEDAFMYYEMFDGDDYYSSNPYVVYTGGDYPLSIATNENDTSGKKILLIRQSFSCTLAPFLSRACSELDIIDPRHYGDSIRAYVEQTQPDLVMVVYCASDTCTSSLFTPLAS